MLKQYQSEVLRYQERLHQLQSNCEGCPCDVTVSAVGMRICGISPGEFLTSNEHFFPQDVAVNHLKISLRYDLECNG